MANSRSPHPLGRDPFQRPTITPGPLGHNDAASPDTPFGFVGDTPGPLGVNDHADPSFRSNVVEQAATSFVSEVRKIARSPDSQSISESGVKFIWKEEYVPRISDRLHWPRGSSGVTLGAGYDMKARTRRQVAEDLRNIGLSVSDSEKASEGAGLGGQAANFFVQKNRNKLLLNEQQALQLLKLILPRYECIVKRLVKVPLQQYEYDALVSFAYNPGGRLSKVANFINNNQINEAMKQMAAANTSGGEVVKGLVARRKREIDLYLKGKYPR